MERDVSWAGTAQQWQTRLMEHEGNLTATTPDVVVAAIVREQAATANRPDSNPPAKGSQIGALWPANNH